jgi:Marseillevirus homing endonuclease
MNQFKTLKDVHIYFEKRGSKIKGLVNDKGDIIKLIDIPRLKQKVKWVCSNNKAHLSTSNFGSVLQNKKEKLCCRSCSISKSKTKKTCETFVEDLQKEDWKMISSKSDYKNTKTVMHVTCYQGHSTKISYANWSRGERSCKLCKNSCKHTISSVRKEFEKRGCKLLEDKYVNNKANMRYICKCGREGMVAYNNFLRATGCKSCTRRFASKRVIKLFEQTDCILLFAHESQNAIKSLYEDQEDTDANQKDDAIDTVIVFHEWPEFVLNSTYLLYICECKNLHITTWKAFKKGVRCLDCTQEKIKITCRELYGVENPFNSKEIQEKAVLTRLEKYGVKYPMELEEFARKAKETNIKNHGGIHNSKLPEQKEARDAAYLEKYGAPFGFVEEHNEKGKAKTREKLGVDYPLQSPVIHTKIKKNNLQKYGAENYLQSETGKKHMMDKYGAENYLQSKTGKKHMMDKYGAESYLQSKTGKQHMMDKYGAPHAMQCPELFEKAMKKAFTTKIFTFPSGKDVFVQGYEPFALQDLLKTGFKENDICTGRKNIPTIKYKFEGVKRVYYPDIYIKSKDLIIEVKSLWTYEREIDKNKAKFKATKKLHNFELWVYGKDGKKLKVSSCFQRKSKKFSQ